MLAQLKAGFMARGADAVTATERAYAALHGMLLQQASMVSFVWLFRLLGGIFLMLLPLILIMRRPKGRVAAAASALRSAFQPDLTNVNGRRLWPGDHRSRRISPVRKRALEERSLRREELQLHDEPREDVALRRGDPRPHRHA